MLPEHLASVPQRTTLLLRRLACGVPRSVMHDLPRCTSHSNLCANNSLQLGVKAAPTTIQSGEAVVSTAWPAASPDQGVSPSLVRAASAGNIDTGARMRDDGGSGFGSPHRIGAVAAASDSPAMAHNGGGSGSGSQGAVSTRKKRREKDHTTILTDTSVSGVALAGHVDATSPAAAAYAHGPAGFDTVSASATVIRLKLRRGSRAQSFASYAESVVRTRRLAAASV